MNLSYLNDFVYHKVNPRNVTLKDRQNSFSEWLTDWERDLLRLNMVIEKLRSRKCNTELPPPHPPTSPPFYLCLLMLSFHSQNNENVYKNGKNVFRNSLGTRTRSLLFFEKKRKAVDIYLAQWLKRTKKMY